MFINQSIHIYTDGGCRFNPGIGAWAFVVVINNQEVYHASGFSPDTTNNKMELQAVLQALLWLKSNTLNCDVTIFSDSQYVVNTMLIYYDTYMANHTWHKKANIETIKSIMSLYDSVGRSYHIQWVRGHSTNIFNNLADRIVNETLQSADHPLW